MVFRSAGLKRPRLPAGAADRVPPGQYPTERWPVLHQGAVPPFDPASWDLRVFGLVDRPLRFSWAAFQALPVVEARGDLHCVSRWSKLDNRWQGVSLRALLEQAGIRPEARFVLFHCEGDYTANIPIEAALRDGALLALEHDGRPLSPEHGFPVRAVLAHLYAWKSAKWLRGVEVLAEDRLGFWERYGYSNSADVWKEERFADQNPEPERAEGTRG